MKSIFSAFHVLRLRSGSPRYYPSFLLSSYFGFFVNCRFAAFATIFLEFNLSLNAFLVFTGIVIAHPADGALHAY